MRHGSAARRGACCATGRRSSAIAGSGCRTTSSRSSRRRRSAPRPSAARRAPRSGPTAPTASGRPSEPTTTSPATAPRAAGRCRSGPCEAGHGGEGEARAGVLGQCSRTPSLDLSGGLMSRLFRRRRVAPAVLVAVLAFAGTASAAVVGLPADHTQVNDDPAVGIDPNQDAGVSDVVGGSLVPGAPNVPWGAFEQKSGTSQQIFVRAFKNGRWVTQGQSLNIQANQEAEAPSIDFAGTGRKVPWTAWYEPNSNLPGGKTNIFASRFNAAANVWVPEGQDRSAAQGVPSLNIHTDRTAENPALVGGAAVAGADPVPWVAWQEKDGATTDDAAKNQIFASRGIKQADCHLNQPGGGTSVSTFCWQQTGTKRIAPDALTSSATGDPTLNIDPTRDGVEPDFAFTAKNDTVPWVVWYEQKASGIGLRGTEQVFAAKAVPGTGDGGFHYVAVGRGTAGQVNPLDASGATHGFGPCAESQAQEDKCSLNAAAGHDAEDPRVAAGTLTPGGTTVPWVTWTEDNGSGVHQIFVARLAGDHFELMNDGQPVSNILNDSVRPDITFAGHTPFVSWQETVAGEARTFVAHLHGERFVLDTPGGVGGAEPDLRAPVSSNCIATPFNADGDACQGGAAPEAFFLHLQAGTPKRLLANAIPSAGSGTPGGAAGGAPSPAAGSGNGGPGAGKRSLRMTISGATLRMDRRGNVRLALTCPAAATTRCRGAVTLRARLAGRVRSVGGTRFVVRHGKRASVRVHLARRARLAVVRRHRLAVVATVRATDAAGLTGVSSRSLPIRPAPRRR